MKIKKFGNTEQLVYDLAAPIAAELGSTIWDVRFEKEGASRYLRVFIDREQGVTIDDCEAVSRPLDKLLDEKDPIPQSYFLEVGSAGIERELIRQSHFEGSLGKIVTVKLYKALDGSKEAVGKLLKYDKESLTLTFPFGGEDAGDAAEKTIPMADISGVRLYDDTEENI